MSTAVTWLMMLVVTMATETIASKLMVDPNSPYCKLDQSSLLVCDFSSTSEDVYLGFDETPNYNSVKIHSTFVLHLAENVCLEDVSIYDTRKVIVDDSYQKKKETEDCINYQLFLINSTITKIPVTVTRLEVIRSTVENLVLHPSIKRVSLLQSQVHRFDTETPLKGSTVVDISYTDINQVEHLKVSENAKIQILSSNLTLMNVRDLTFHHNATVIISKSRLISTRSLKLSIEDNVSITLDDATIGKVIIKRSPEAHEVVSNNHQNIINNHMISHQPQSLSSESTNNINYVNLIIIIIFLFITFAVLLLFLWKFDINWKCKGQKAQNLDPENTGNDEECNKLNSGSSNCCSRDSGIMIDKETEIEQASNDKRSWSNCTTPQNPEKTSGLKQRTSSIKKTRSATRSTGKQISRKLFNCKIK